VQRLERTPMINSPEQEPIWILLIEEEPRVRDALKALLGSWEFNVADVSNADEASDTIQYLKPDVVLLSLVGDDEQFDTQMIRDMLALCGGAPLLVLFAKGNEDSRTRVIRLGARGVIVKTKTGEELQKAIHEAHRIARSERRSGGLPTAVSPCHEKQLLVAHNR